MIYGLTADPNGNVYAGTYPTAHAFKYDPSNGQVTDYGSLDPVQQYARSTVYDPDHNKLFVGISTPNARLLRIDVATRQVEDITPPGTTAKDFIDLDYAGGRIFANASSRLVVVDAVTGEQIKFTDCHDRHSGHGLPDRSPRCVRSRSRWRVLHHQHARPHPLRPRHQHGRAGVTAADADPWRLDRLRLGHRERTARAVRLGGQLLRRHVPVQPAGRHTRAVELTVPVRPGRHSCTRSPTPRPGKVFVNAYLNGSTSVYDPATGKSTVTTRQGQVEDWAWDNTGKLYVGIYPYGRLSLWDPNAPASPTNPKELFSLVDSHHQNRPVSVVPAGNRVYVGTTPAYGEYGGALTVYDVPTGAFTVYRNLVRRPDHLLAAASRRGAVGRLQHRGRSRH